MIVSLEKDSEEYQSRFNKAYHSPRVALVLNISIQGDLNEIYANRKKIEYSQYTFGDICIRAFSEILTHFYCLIVVAKMINIYKTLFRILGMPNDNNLLVGVSTRWNSAWHAWNGLQKRTHAWKKATFISIQARWTFQLQRRHFFYGLLSIWDVEGNVLIICIESLLSSSRGFRLVYSWIGKSTSLSTRSSNYHWTINNA